MKLSCIILTYNEEEFIKQCIDSIKNQDFDDYEIIVVDDGSTDDTLQILESIEGIKLIKSNHVGHAAARNIGMRKASADIVFFVEADAIYSQNFLRDCYTRFANKDVGGGIGKLEVWNKDTPWTRCRNAELNARFSDYKPFTGWMYSKKLVEQVGGFDEKLSIGEDRCVGIKIQELGYKIVYEPNAIWYHREPNTLNKIIKKRFFGGIEIINFYKIIGLPKVVLVDVFAFTCLLFSIIYLPFIVLFIGYLLAHLFFVRKYFHFVDKKSLWLYMPIYLIAGRLTFVIGRFVGMLKYGVPSKISHVVID